MKSVKGKNIGFDFDGVIADHTQNKIRLAREAGFEISPDDTPGPRLRKIVGEENYLKIRAYIYKNCMTGATVMKDAHDVLERINEVGWASYLISRRFRGDGSRPAARKWLAQNLPGVFRRGRIFFVRSEEDKADLCRKIEIKIYLDDDVSVLRKLSGTRKCLFDPYGIGKDLELGDIRPVASWREFYESLSR